MNYLSHVLQTIWQVLHYQNQFHMPEIEFCSLLRLSRATPEKNSLRKRDSSTHQKLFLKQTSRRRNECRACIKTWRKGKFIIHQDKRKNWQGPRLFSWCTTWLSLSLAFQPMTFGSVYRRLLFSALFVLGKMAFPTIVPSWLHKFPIKELNYYSSMALCPLWQVKSCCAKGGEWEEAEGYNPKQNLLWTEALKGTCYREQFSCLHSKRVSCLCPENKWKEILGDVSVESYAYHSISVVITQIFLHETDRVFKPNVLCYQQSVHICDAWWNSTDLFVHEGKIGI